MTSPPTLPGPACLRVEQHRETLDGALRVHDRARKLRLHALAGAGGEPGVETREIHVHPNDVLPHALQRLGVGLGHPGHRARRWRWR